MMISKMILKPKQVGIKPNPIHILATSKLNGTHALR